MHCVFSDSTLDTRSQDVRDVRRLNNEGNNKFDNQYLRPPDPTASSILPPLPKNDELIYEGPLTKSNSLF